MPSSEASGSARLFMALVAWAGAVAGGLLLTMVVAHGIHTSPPAAAIATGHPRGPSTSTFDPKSVQPADRRSLFVDSNFPRVLHIVRAHLGPRTGVESVRIAPGEAPFIVIRRGAEHFISARTNGDYSDYAKRPVTASTEVFDLSQIHSYVPATLARRIARHGGVPISRLSYMVIATNPVEHVFIWGVYAKNSDLHFQAASASGQIQKFTASGRRTLNG